MTESPTLSVSVDGLTIAVRSVATDHGTGAITYRWEASDETDAAPFHWSTFWTGRSSYDLPRALRIAVEYAAAGSQFSPQPPEMRRVNPDTFARLLAAVGVEAATCSDCGRMRRVDEHSDDQRGEPICTDCARNGAYAP